jgi:hypothetical protein
MLEGLVFAAAELADESEVAFVSEEEFEPASLASAGVPLEGPNGDLIQKSVYRKYPPPKTAARMMNPMMSVDTRGRRARKPRFLVIISDGEAGAVGCTGRTGGVVVGRGGGAIVGAGLGT